MSKRRPVWERPPSPRVAVLFRSAKANAADVEEALNAGDCGAAVRALAAAYESYGEARGYAQARREMKGRKGSTPVMAAKHAPYLYRLKVKTARACGVPR